MSDDLDMRGDGRMNHQDFLLNKPWPMNVLKTLAEYGYKMETRGPYRGPETVLIWDPSGDSILTANGTMTHSPASAAALGLGHLANEVRKYDIGERLEKQDINDFDKSMLNHLLAECQ